MIYGVAATLAFMATMASANLYNANPEHLKYMFEMFKKEYGKTYTTMEEESHRFQTFVDNLRIADDRNLLERHEGGSAQHGITIFSDLTQAEFESRYLKSNPALKASAADEVLDNVVYEGTASSVDWSGKYTTPVKNQGYCGSCWAFSATEQIESDAIRSLGVSYVLSPEQIVDCDKTSFGCDGGWTERAYSYVKNAGGISQEKDYPYTAYYGKAGSCAANSSKFVIKVSGYTTISGETNMANYVLSKGPLSVCIDATTWNSYTGGIVSTCGKQINHCVQAVGVDTGSSWKVRNSWGTSWGESGYIRLKYGQNTCGITNDPTYVTVSKK